MIKNNKNLLKAISIATLSMSIMTLSEVSAFAAWKENSTGWWYDYDDSSYAIGWKNINNTWYYFDENGYMKTGWVNDGYAWYFLDNSGAMQTDWIKDNSTWYFLNSDGSMKTGWVKDNAKWYFLDNSGAMQTGWVQIDQYNKAYLYSDGSQPEGWFEVDGKTYYSEPGKCVRTTCVIDNYLIDKDGVRQNKIKVDTYDDAKALVEKEDSEFIKKIQSKVPDYKCSSCRMQTYMPGSKDFGIPDEPSFTVVYSSESSEFDKYIYYVGSYTGKVFISPDSLTRIYEIKDNQVVKSYDATAEYNPSDVPDWR